MPKRTPRMSSNANPAADRWPHRAFNLSPVPTVLVMLQAVEVLRLVNGRQDGEGVGDGRLLRRLLVSVHDGQCRTSAMKPECVTFACVLVARAQEKPVCSQPCATAPITLDGQISRIPAAEQDGTDIWPATEVGVLMLQ